MGKAKIQPKSTIWIVTNCTFLDIWVHVDQQFSALFSLKDDFVKFCLSSWTTTENCSTGALQLI